LQDTHHVCEREVDIKRAVSSERAISYTCASEVFFEREFSCEMRATGLLLGRPPAST
jgi:hypothetical protein